MNNHIIWEKLNTPVFFIAEIGKNFIQTKEDRPNEEYLDNAKALVRLAKAAGADAVKFQTHNVEDEQLKVRISSPHFSESERYDWVRRNTGIAGPEFWREIKEYCDDLSILFFSTPMSRGAAKILEGIGTPIWKVGSGDILDFVMLDYIAGTGKPIIISSGMSTLEEIDKSINFLKKRTEKIILLYCVSKYPCLPEEFNLKNIIFFKNRYGLPVGFSDHSIGGGAVKEAVEMGAGVVEKHFSLSQNLWGSDHKVSMMPEGFKDMVDNIRKLGKINPNHRAGNGEKVKVELLSDDEAVFRPIFRKSLMAGRKIMAGEILKKEMVYAMRPQAYAGGLLSEEYENVIGKRVNKNLNQYDPITQSVLI